ncbi:DNA polymerase III subunit gamma/tau [Limnohabitans sp. 2KL-1]|uniref:DNA polymerase III subunit gamma/tau n=2 Tax=unclassified Limnohabitans TaxID=2626134 RepID=UPI000D3670F1|nr:DNA polymerase III subunit gamma/tau [Limnohabitans sp. 2KL-1]PUE49298.1 DNA polymerase III subunit gamma/tau [Limnohabitans sp. 2KL-1]
MSYLVLARKYRPRNFTEMVGQEHVVQALTNALVQQRLHHAYLFTGTRGVGKTTVSRILAKSLNCQGADGQGGITAEPCGVCQACRDIDAGRFVDYTELDAASNRGVDEVQSLLEQAVYKPVQGRFKVFMIDEVHMLTNTAFNAMLKTLEEPPEYLKFVLATTDPQKVPVTVLSRCLQFNLRPMAPETVFEHLTQVLAAEQLSAEPLALRLLARAARGSMRDALSLTDQAIAFGNGQLQEAGVRQMLGSVDRSHVLQMIRALTDGDGATVVAQVNALRLQGVSAAATLEDMAMLLQRMAVMQMVPSMAQDGDDPDTQGLADLAAAMPAEETQLLYSLCLHGRTELGLAPDEYAALTMVLLRLLAFKPQSGAAEKKSPRISAPVADAAAALSPTSVSVPATPARAAVLAPAPVTIQPVADASLAQSRATPPSAPHAVQRDSGAALSPPPGQPEPPMCESVLSQADEAVAAQTVQAPAPSRAQGQGQSVAHPGASASHDEPPPWQDWPDTTDYSDGNASVSNEAKHVPEHEPELGSLGSPPPPPALRSLPVREVAAPSLRADVPHAAGPAAVQATPQGDVWLDVVQGLMAQEVITALVRELALQSQLLARDADQWQLRVERETLNHPASRDRLQAALQAAGHGDVKLQIEIGPVTDSPAKRLAVKAAEKMLAAQALIQNDPLVQAMVRDFGAKIVPGSLQLI